MSSIYNWSTIAANNANSDSAINWAEGQPPSTVNNSARQLEARIAEFLADQGGALTAGGTANALTVTANSAFTAYQDGLILAVRIATDNTAASTLNANSIGAKSIRKMVFAGEVALSGNEMQATGIYLFRYSTALNSAAGGWLLLNPTIDAPSFAPLASPALTGNPTAPTPTAGDSDTSIATTAFVTGGIATAIAALSSVYQAASAVLTALAGIGTAVAGDVIYASGAGTWARRAKGSDGQILQLASGLPTWAANNVHIGEGQTWQDVTASRASGTAYQNSTTRPILVAITGDRCRLSVSADNVTYVGDFRTIGDSTGGTATVILPVGWYVKLNSVFTLINWSELR